MIKIYELGKSLNFSFESKKYDDILKFTLFPYSFSAISATGLLALLFFITLGILVEFFLPAEIVFVTFVFFGLLSFAFLLVYPLKIYPQLKIMEYKKEMLNTIMRFSTYLAMHSNIEFAVKNSLPYTRGILEVQLKDILLKLERKVYKNIGEAFKEYSLIWNKYSPEFVDALKLLEVASLSSGVEGKRIMNDAIDQVLLSYNIEQKRNSEDLSEKISKFVSIGIMLPVMFLMLIPLVSVFLPGVMTAGVLFFIFNIIVPSFLLSSALDFSAKRVQFSDISIEDSEDYKKVKKIYYIFAGIMFLAFVIPSLYYLSGINIEDVNYTSYTMATIFFIWLIPAGISAVLFYLSSLYLKNNADLMKRFEDIEEDIPHLLNYFSTYLSLNVPLENIFEEISRDYKRHGFENHPTLTILDKITFRLQHLKINLDTFIRSQLERISSIKVFNEILKQINSFSEFSLSEAASSAKKIREQRVSLIKLNDYILTLLNPSIALISSTILMLSPLLSALAIIMSLFIVNFMKFLTEQLEVIANLGSAGGQRVEISLIDLESIVSPIYLEMIIGFYIVEILLILSLLKSNIKNGHGTFYLIRTIKESQVGFIVFSACLFGGYLIFSRMFAATLGVNFE